MAEQPHTGSSFDLADGQPLIGIPMEEDGRCFVRFFVDEETADRELAGRPKDGRHLAGIWSDLDWEAFAEELDRIRHESKPTPPIEFDF
jgi:hypothetical protein